MILLAFSLFVDAICLVMFFGPIEWMYRRGWRILPRLFAVLSVFPLAMFPAGVAIFSISEGKPFFLSSLTLLKIVSVIFGAATTLIFFLYFIPILNGIKPLSAYGTVRENSLAWVEKRASPFIILSPAIAFVFLLTGLGVAEGKAATIGGYVGLPCWALGQYLVPRRREKALKKYGSLRHIKRTLTRPVMTFLTISFVAGGSIAYYFGATADVAPALGLGVVLLIWRIYLRPARKDEFAFPMEMSWWKASDLADEIGANMENTINSIAPVERTSFQPASEPSSSAASTYSK